MTTAARTPPRRAPTGRRPASASTAADAAEGPVQRDLDGVRAHLEHLCDLAGGQVGAEAKRDEVALAPVEPRQHAGDVESKLVVALGRRALGKLGKRREPVGEEVVDR